MLGLSPLAVEGQHVDAAGVGAGHRLWRQERVASPRVDAAAQPDPPGHPLGGGQQPGAEASGGAQHDGVGRGAVGARELRGEVEDAAHLRAAEAVDALVRVADGDEVATVAGQRPEQGDLAGVGVLVLVDEDEPVALAQLGLVHPGLQHRAAQQVGVVGGALRVEVVEVAGHEPPGRLHLDQPVLGAQGGQLLGLQPLLPGAREHRPHLAGEPPGGDGAAEALGPAVRLVDGREQLGEHHVLLGGRQQAQRSGVQLGGGVVPQQREREGVEGRAGHLGHGAAEPRGDPVAQLLRGLAGERQREHRGRVEATLLDPLDDRLHQRRGLAGAGAGQHEQRPAGVLHDGALVLVEGGRGRATGGGPGEAVRRHDDIGPSGTDSGGAGCQKARARSTRPEGRSGVPSSR